MRALSAVCAVAALFSSVNTLAAEFALYPTGPSEDAAFIRFVNASSAPLDVIAQAGQPPMRLEAAKPVSLFFPVQSSSPVKGTLVSGAQKLAMDMKIAPGEFVTVVALPDGNGIKQVVVREQPDDFNGLKASLAYRRSVQGRAGRQRPAPFDQPGEPVGATGVHERQYRRAAGPGRAESGRALQRAAGAFGHRAASSERHGRSVPLIGFCRCYGLRLT